MSSQYKTLDNKHDSRNASRISLGRSFSHRHIIPQPSLSSGACTSAFEGRVMDNTWCLSSGVSIPSPGALTGQASVIAQETQRHGNLHSAETLVLQDAICARKLASSMTRLVGKKNNALTRCSFRQPLRPVPTIVRLPPSSDMAIASNVHQDCLFPVTLNDPWPKPYVKRQHSSASTLPRPGDSCPV